MTENDLVYIGIDPTAGKRPISYAVLDSGLKRIAEGSGTADVVLAAVLAYPAAAVAIDAPQSPNSGLMANPDYRASLSPRPNGRSYANFKVCEYQLRQRGIRLYNTPGDAAEAVPWMQIGFRLYAGLREAGYEQYRPDVSLPRRVLEVHPHACFTVLLGRVPLSKNSLEGRLQRQMLLFREGLDVLDPLDALEEITPRRLLEGSLELPGVLTHDQLDAQVAAYTAYLAANSPAEITLVGDRSEGQIVVPISASDLKAWYSR